MLVSDVLVAESIRVGVDAPDKESVVRALAQLLHRCRPEATEDAFFEALLEREWVATTGVGSGVALPHAWADVTGSAVALAISATGMPFDTLDGAPVHIVLAVVSPRASAAEHVKLLVRTTRVLSDQAFCARLRGAESASDALEIWRHEERRH